MRCLPGGRESEVLTGPWSVRNTLMGYGGRPYLVAARDEVGGDVLVFTEHSDGRLYSCEVEPLPAVRGRARPVPITPPDPDGLRTAYADPVLGPDRREVFCVREVTHRPGAGDEGDDPSALTRRDIVAIPLDASAARRPELIRRVAGSHHFLSGVRVSPDGRRLAWIGWDHPSMPWDSSWLVVADLVDGVASGVRTVLGGASVSVPQAEWADPDSLYAMADPDGWWNLHRIRLDADPVGVECVLPMPQECAGALWRVGATWFAVTSAGVVLRHGVGAEQLALWDPDSGSLVGLATEWTEFGSYVGGTRVGSPSPAVALVAASTSRLSCVLRVPVSTEGPLGSPIVCTPVEHAELAPWIPHAQRRTARGPDGREVHYVFYPPTNPDVVGPAGQRPPLLVDVHGGPTSGAGASPDLEYSLFCSRGFTVASVDYGGSTGYGRAYRERLRHRWGVVDVEDCVAVATELIAGGEADGARTAIRGGSAGGWTTLATLASSELFAAGAVYYPISDPLTWSGGDTHDFESQYLRSLIGELPEDLDRYQAVSPLGKADRIRSPLVLLQGADDTICRPDQARRIVDAVARRGLWHRYLVFPGEGHGFRLESSVAASLQAEAELYRHAMGVMVYVDRTPTHDEGRPR